MATLTKTTVVQSGVDNPTKESCASGGDVFDNDGSTLIMVKNDDSGSHDVTINSIAACDQGFDHNEVITVAAAEEKIVGPFPKRRFNSPAGQVAVTYDDETGMSISVLQP